MTIIIVFELLIFLFLYCIARIKVAQIPPDTLLHRLRRNATWIDSLSDEELDAMTYCTCFLGVPDPWCPMHGEFPPYVFGHGACNTGVAVAASEESDVAPREAQKTRCQRCGKVAADVQPSYGLCKLPERHLLCDGCYAELVADLQRKACPDLPQQDGDPVKRRAHMNKTAGSEWQGSAIQSEILAMLVPGQWLTLVGASMPNGGAYSLSVRDDEVPGSNIIAVTDEELLVKLRSVKGQFAYLAYPVFCYEHLLAGGGTDIITDERTHLAWRGTGRPSWIAMGPGIRGAAR